MSWGKVKREASKVQVFSDATITVPLVVQALRASGKRRKSVPVFDWKDVGLELRYERDEQNVHWVNSRKLKTSLLLIFMPKTGRCRQMWF